MAAFHFSAKIHSRANGASAVRAAAYRAGARLYDARAGVHEDYTRKADVLESAILAPVGAPIWVQDRNDLWNRAEAAERRRDSQVAQELEINLPRELSDEENWQLIRDFAREHLVAHGRVCDINLHIGRAADGEPHPHAHILMPVRALTDTGFGEKHSDCSWKTFVKRRDRLNELREVWCTFARDRARELGHDLGHEWDHRSFETRGIDLEPQPKRGATAQRLDRQNGDAATPADRTQEKLNVQRRNGAALLCNPGIALFALTQQHATFSDADLARYIHRHCCDDQFQAILAKARPLAIEVGRDLHGRSRFSTEAMIALEARMVENAVAMAGDCGHAVSRQRIPGLRHGLSTEQVQAAAHLLTAGDLACLTGYAGSGKSTLLGAAREAWEAEGYTVRGAALSGIAAEGLRTGSGIEARTIASLTRAWEREAERLGPKDVLVVDEAGMIGSRQLAELVERCRECGAKLVLVGDPEQLQAIEAGAAYRAIAERTGAHSLTEIWRQRTDWQRAATRAFADGRTSDALSAYRGAGCIEARTTDADARLHLVERWLAGRAERPEASRIMLTHRNDDVRQLNIIARDLLRAEGALGLDERVIAIEDGERAFATGDRLLFRRNDRSMDVRNGTIGTVAALDDGVMSVRLDDGRTVAFDPAVYRDIDHGYAVTCHKAQGVTVDESYILATRGFDRHLAYVAGTRHRDSMTMVWSRESFDDERAMVAALRRERAKDTTLDYELAPVQVPERGPQREKAGGAALLAPTQTQERRDGRVSPIEGQHPHRGPDITTGYGGTTLRGPTLDYPAPRPTQAFIDANQPKPERPISRPDRERPAPARDEVAEAWARFGDEHATPERSWERQRNRDRGLER